MTEGAAWTEEGMRGFFVAGMTEGGANAEIARAVYSGRISYGVIQLSAYRDPPGVFLTANDDGLREQLAQFFRSRGFDVQAAEVTE